LVTLTGPPGIGKSRLALELAADLADRHPGGAALVDLTPIENPALVGGAVAAALGIHESPDQPLVARIAEMFGEAAFLLVLDNFEHLLEAAPVVGELLSACPGLRVLATSRVPLHLQWEHEFPVPPLALPDLDALPAPEVLAECPAVALFLARARAAAPDFGLDERNAKTVAEICCRLDGLPLAIELAAPRAKLLPPGAMLARLQHRLNFLRRVGRDLPARHRTLRAAIGWSYALLQPPEQALLRRLSVFVGGFALEAAEAVCWSAEMPCDALDALNALVDASLVSREASTDDVRFRILETIREFGSEQLAASGELPRTQRHHAAYFLALAEDAESQVHGPEEGRWLQRLEREHDNLRAAMSFVLREREPHAALRLAKALWWFWYVRGHLREGRAWLETALAAAPDAAPAMRAGALHGLGVLAWRQGDFARATHLGEQSLGCFREAGDRLGAANALFLLEMVARSRGDYARAMDLLEESLALFQEIEDAWGVATALLNLGTAARIRGDHARAAACHEESLRLFRQQQDISGTAASLYSLGLVARDRGDLRQAASLADEALEVARVLGDPSRVAFALYLQGLVARDRADYERASAVFEESLALFRQIGDAWGIAYSLSSLGTLARLQGSPARAAAFFYESLDLRSRYGDRLGIAECLEGLAATAVEEERAEHAARLFGAASALREALGTPLRRPDQADYDRGLAVARAALRKRKFEVVWSEGRTVSIERLLQNLLATRGQAELGRPPAAPPASGLTRTAGPLTPREVEVARLVAQGRTNREIASALYVTEGTVATHIQHILTKLGYHSRAQIAAWVAASMDEGPRDATPA
jgi:predicted ATPase/DNA-binding CsgD family transcriptional regulator